MKTNPKHEHLLDEVLAPHGLRAASLEATLSAVRRRRHRVQVTKGAVAMLAASIVLLFVVKQTTAPARQSKVAVAVPPSTTPLEAQPPTVPGTKIRLISEEELLALFPGRPVALAGPPGKRQLLFLDTPRTPMPAETF